MRAGWWALCALHLVPGLAAVAAPGWFAQELAGLPTDAPHFARDVGVAELMLAAAAALAALRPSARAPVAALLVLHLVLHTASHLADGVGGGAVPALAAQALLLAAVSVAGRRPAPRRPPGASAPAPP